MAQGRRPQWLGWVVGLGMATSIGGMLIRFISHRHDRKDIHRIERKAEG